MWRAGARWVSGRPTVAVPTLCWRRTYAVPTYYIPTRAVVHRAWIRGEKDLAVKIDRV